MSAFAHRPRGEGDCARPQTIQFEEVATGKGGLTFSELRRALRQSSKASSAARTVRRSERIPGMTVQPDDKISLLELLELSNNEGLGRAATAAERIAENTARQADAMEAITALLASVFGVGTA